MLARSHGGVRSSSEKLPRWILAFQLAWLILGSGSTSILSPAGLPQQPAQKVSVVSLIQLIATPERFEGRRVQVEGFCRLVFEEQSLYLHREDSELLNTANSVWLDVTREGREALNDTFARVEGTFTQTQHGHLGMWPGSLGRISRLERVRTRTIPARR
jgi:hypothetical protein